MDAFLVVCVLGGLAALASPFLRREWTWVRLAVIGFSFAALGRYMLWRFAEMPRPELTWFSFGCWLVLLIEIVAGYMAITDLLLLKRTTNRSRETDAQLDWYGKKQPRVDVIIATYNEPWEVLEKTLVGAKSQNYSNYHAWIFDDGNRAWLRDKAAESNIGYVTRTDNRHYKAGNLNNGCRVLAEAGIELEYLALLDADFIARPEFLRRTLALMKSEDVGIVQTPQCFYNPDPHQVAFGGVKRWPDEQRGWFDLYLPSLDAMDAATCCGTSCLVRRKALDAIGGFPTESVCEDTLSSIKMQQKGFRTVYLHERLTVGLAPEGIGEFLSQRARWLLGGVQNTRACGYAPGAWGRVQGWLNLWRMAIFGIMPLTWIVLSVIYWFTGVSLIRIQDFDEALSYFSPLWLDRIFQGWLFGGRQMFFVADAIWVLLAPMWIRHTFLAVIGSQGKFKVTDKAVHKHRRVVHWRLLPFHAFLLFLLVAGAVYTMTDLRAPVHHDGFWQVNTLLTALFVLTILAGIAPLVESPKRRAGDRYPSSEEIVARLDGRAVPWRCEDISIGGIAVHTGGVVPPASVELVLEGVGPVRSRLVRTLPSGGAAFAFDAPGAREDLIRKLYFTDRYIATPERWSLGVATAAFFKRLLF